MCYFKLNSSKYYSDFSSSHWFLVCKFNTRKYFTWPKFQKWRLEAWGSEIGKQILIELACVYQGLADTNFCQEIIVCSCSCWWILFQLSIYSKRQILSLPQKVPHVGPHMGYPRFSRDPWLFKPIEFRYWSGYIPRNKVTWRSLIAPGVILVLLKLW